MIDSGGSAKLLRASWLVGLGCLVALVLGGCSSGQEASTTTAATEAIVQPTSSTTSEQPTTTPSTTEPPETSAEDAAAQAVLDKEAAWRSCIADVPNCDVDASLSASTTGESLDKRRETLETWRTNGWEALPPLDPSHLSDEIVEVEILDGETRARVRHCQIDGGILVDPGAGSDGSDVIINDDVVSVLSDAFVVLGDDAVWRVEEIEVLSRVEGGDGCTSDT